MSFHDQVLNVLPQHSSVTYIRGDLTVNDPVTFDDGRKYYGVELATIGMSFRFACEQVEHARFAQFNGQEVGCAVELTSKDNKQLKIKRVVHLAPMEQIAAAAGERRKAA